MTTDLFEEIRALDPALAIAARGADRTARSAVHAATHTGLSRVRPRRFRPVRGQLPTSWRGRPLFASNTLPLLAKAALVLGVLLMGTTVGVIFSLILKGPGVRPGLAVMAALGVVVGVPLGHRLGRSVILAILALWSIAGILAFTVIADLPRLHDTPTPWTWPGFGRVFNHPTWSDLTEWTIFPHGPLKVLLYLPAGLLLTALTRRPGRVALGLIGLSLTVDIVRAWATDNIGFNGNGNVIAETIGALLGVGLAVALSKISDHSSAGLQHLDHDEAGIDSPETV